jgi:hypothetical protein
MRYRVFLGTVFVSIFAPLSEALAHVGLADGEDIGHGMFWAYGLVFTALISFVFYRQWASRQGTSEQRSLNRHLKVLERALNSCLKQLKNAEEYPNECGLTDVQRRESLESVTLIQTQIAETKEILSAT